MTEGLALPSAEPAEPTGTSGRFAPDAWWLHLPGDDPRTAQYASAHESHHFQLQNATIFGALIRTLSALHEATGEERYRHVAAQLTASCRHVQEAFATWAPAVALGWTRSELVAAYSSYARQFDAMDRLAAPVRAPYLRLHARPCTRPCLHAAAYLGGRSRPPGLDHLTLADLRQNHLPDSRLAVLRRNGIDWRAAVQAASRRFRDTPVPQSGITHSTLLRND